MPIRKSTTVSKNNAKPKRLQSVNKAKQKSQYSRANRMAKNKK